jgi:hypothetical protein
LELLVDRRDAIGNRRRGRLHARRKAGNIRAKANSQIIGHFTVSLSQKSRPGGTVWQRAPGRSSSAGRSQQTAPPADHDHGGRNDCSSAGATTNPLGVPPDGHELSSRGP